MNENLKTCLVTNKYAYEYHKTKGCGGLSDT